MSNNQTSFGLTRPTWQSVGTEVDQGLRTEDAIEQAGLNWGVTKEPLYTQNALGEIIPCKYDFAIVRSDMDGPGRQLGVVGSRYKPVTNAECFDFMDSIIGEAGATYECAGSLWGGARVWMMARLPEQDIWIEGTDDITKSYLLLHTTHNGQGAVTASLTPIRMWCSNMLQAALNNATRTWSVVHTGDPVKKLRAATVTMGRSAEYMKEFNEIANDLARRPIKPAELNKLTEWLFPPATSGEVSTQTANNRSAIVWAFENLESANVPGIQGSRWAAWQAVTAWADHARTTRVQGATDLTPEQIERQREELRFFSNTQGDSATLKDKAFQALIRKTIPELKKVA